VTLTPRFEKKLITTQVAKQAKKTQEATFAKDQVLAETRVQVAEYTKNLTILGATGIAEAYRINRRAIATADSNLIKAQAQSIQIVKTTVCPSHARVPDQSGSWRLPYVKKYTDSDDSVLKEATAEMLQERDIMLRHAGGDSAASNAAPLSDDDAAKRAETQHGMWLDIENKSNHIPKWTCSDQWIMNNNRVVQYQTQVFLNGISGSNFAYKAKGGTPPEAINVEAQRNIMKGRARRLLLQDSGYQKDKDARRLMQKSDASQGHNAAKSHRQVLMKESGWRPEEATPIDATNQVLRDASDGDAGLHEL